MSKMEWDEDYFDILGTSAGVVSVLHQRGEAVVSAAKSLAPVVTGNYRDSIRLSERQADHRTVVTITADADYAMVVEGRHNVLHKAIRAAGG